MRKLSEGGGRYRQTIYSKFTHSLWPHRLLKASQLLFYGEENKIKVNFSEDTADIFLS